VFVDGVSRMAEWSPEDRELDVLSRQYAGVIQRCRLEALGERLASGGPIAILHSTCGFSGERWSLRLADGHDLRLRLYWPRRSVVRELWSVRWRDEVGWQLAVKSADGQALVLIAYLAEIR